MIKIKNNTKIVVAMAATAIASGGVGVVALANANEDLGQCHGINSCRGQSAGASATNSCAGQNACAGKGWLKMSAQDCKNKGGRFLPLNTK